MHGLSNILELIIATFLYLIYHQRARKTNLFHMRGGRFHAGNTLCTFNLEAVIWLAFQLKVHNRIPESYPPPLGYIL